MGKLTIIAALAAPLAAIAGVSEIPSVKFADGVSMPRFGIGTAAQVILRWHIQEGFSVIPGATREDYIKENISIFDFELTAAEMAKIRALNKEKLFFNPPPGSERMYLNGSFLEQ